MSRLISNENLISVLRSALADLYGIMPEFDPGGERAHPGWQTIDDLRQIIAEMEGTDLVYIDYPGEFPKSQEELVAEWVEDMKSRGVLLSGQFYRVTIVENGDFYDLEVESDPDTVAAVYQNAYNNEQAQDAADDLEAILEEAGCKTVLNWPPDRAAWPAWLHTWEKMGDEMPCPECYEVALSTQDGLTVCRACGWQDENPLNNYPEYYEEH